MALPQAASTGNALVYLPPFPVLFIYLDAKVDYHFGYTGQQ